MAYRQNELSPGGKIVGTILMLAILACTQLTGCFVRESVAVRALENQGFSNVKIIERDIFFIGFRGGDQNDAVRFQCQTTNPLGKEVKVHVFSGWLFRGATIREP